MSKDQKDPKQSEDKEAAKKKKKDKPLIPDAYSGTVAVNSEDEVP